MIIPPLKTSEWATEATIRLTTEKLMGKSEFRGISPVDSLTPADWLEGIAECLVVLREKGCKLAIGSSSKNTPRILERTALRPVFDAVIDGNNRAGTTAIAVGAVTDNTYRS